ncbi:hypothetical protein N184_28360 [Sinorhizobium sp. GL28]|nr:hypothetical protein N184_28360 [Sinorhizobium sp. GL28]
MLMYLSGVRPVIPLIQNAEAHSTSLARTQSCHIRCANELTEVPPPLAQLALVGRFDREPVFAFTVEIGAGDGVDPVLLQEIFVDLDAETRLFSDLETSSTSAGGLRLTSPRYARSVSIAMEIFGVDAARWMQAVFTLG